MNKYIATSISICLLVITLSIGYYFLVYLPQNNEEKREGAKAQQSLENNIKCRDLGMKAYYEELKEFDEMNENPLMSTWYVIEPEFRFNESLNTCLYKGGNKTIYEKLFVKDLYTNSEIATWTHSSGQTKGGSKEEYDEAVNKYFSAQ